MVLAGCVTPPQTIETRLAADTDGSNIAKIIVSADRNQFGKSFPSPPSIYVDDQKMGTFNFGDRLLADVAAGRHTVRVNDTIFGAQIPAEDEVSFILEPGDTIHLGYGLTLSGVVPISPKGQQPGSIFGKFVFYLISGPDRLGLPRSTSPLHSP